MSTTELFEKSAEMHHMHLPKMARIVTQDPQILLLRASDITHRGTYGCSVTIALNAVLHVSSSNLHISFSNSSMTLYNRLSLRMLKKTWKFYGGSEVIDRGRVGEQGNG